MHGLLRRLSSSDDKGGGYVRGSKPRAVGKVWPVRIEGGKQSSLTTVVDVVNSLFQTYPHLLFSTVQGKRKRETADSKARSRYNDVQLCMRQD